MNDFLRFVPQAQPTKSSCYRACVASILGYDVNGFPVCFDGDNWDQPKQQQVLATYGYQLLEIVLKDSPRLYPLSRPVPCILTGISPRQECASGRHAVVAMTTGLDGFEVVWDPYVDDPRGIVGDPEFVTFLLQVSRDAKPRTCPVCRRHNAKRVDGDEWACAHCRRELEWQDIPRIASAVRAGQLVKEWRRGLGLGLREAADLLRVVPSVWSEVENGTKPEALLEVRRAISRYSAGKERGGDT